MSYFHQTAPVTATDLDVQPQVESAPLQPASVSSPHSAAPQPVAFRSASHVQSPASVQASSLHRPLLCHITSCCKVFSSTDDKRHHEHTRIPSDRGQEAQAVSIQDQECNDDHVFNYSSNFMNLALLERDFQDAVHEMDGPRLLRLWKFKMLHFKEAGRSKYALEALLFQAD